MRKVPEFEIVNRVIHPSINLSTLHGSRVRQDYSVIIHGNMYYTGVYLRNLRYINFHVLFILLSIMVCGSLGNPLRPERDIEQLKIFKHQGGLVPVY